MNLYERRLAKNRSAGNYQRALSDYDTYIELKDSIFTKKKNQQISEIQTRFETKQTEKELKIQKLETQKAETIRNYLLIILFLIIVLLLFVYSRYKLKEKANKKIREREKELEHLTEELKTQKELLEKSEAELGEANSAKDKFISIMAHDIKNPLGTIIGFSDNLKEDYDELDDKEKKEYISSIEQVSNNLLELLNNLLNWAQLQDNRLHFHPKDVRLNEIIENSVKYYRDTAKNKNISINAQEDGDLIVKADPDMLQTILRNLINNSIKFTEKSGSVNIKALNDNGNVKLEVEDTGIGMNEEELSKLLKIDEHFSSTGTNREKGSGLGLLLCKEMIDKHNSKLNIESRKNEGSRFYFYLERSIRNKN